jgi:hypothetical protein
MMRSYILELSALDLLTTFQLCRLKYQTARRHLVDFLPRSINAGLFFLFLPLSVTYFLWIHVPFVVCSFVWGCIVLFLEVVARRSYHAKRLLIHISALLEIFSSFYDQIITTKLSVLIEHLAQTFCDLVASFWSRPASNPKPNSSFVTEYHDLLVYEEFEDEFPSEIYARQKIHRVMHNYIPTNLFKATVRLSKMNSPREGDIDDLALDVDKESPTSFPTTPFSRARIMNSSAERTNYVMFAARDRLRLEAQSVSRDEYSRNAALKAKTSGQRATFDPDQKSEGLALTCGNHCALKVGQGLCCSCRSTLPIHENVFVYIEFSITVTGSTVPILCIGLAPPDCPLNVMAGHWPRSLALFNDGQLAVDSRLFPDISFASLLMPTKVMAGSTVGMLVYLQDPSTQTQIEGHFDSDNKKRHGVFSACRDVIDTAFGTVKNVVSMDKQDKKELLKSTGQTTFERRREEEAKGMLLSTKSMDSLDLLPRFSINSNVTENTEMTETTDITEITTKQKTQENTFRNTINNREESDSGRLFVRWNINGRESKFSSDAVESLHDTVSMKTPLYPTISISSKDTRVWCRFCEADIVCKIRDVIGAPKGVRVYCLDGSLLLNEND